MSGGNAEPVCLPVDHDELMRIMTTLALAAGSEILSVRERGITVSAKSDDSPVTEADRRAEAVILAGLREHFPEIPVIAEEEVAEGRVPETGGAAFFLVDPLDGTREFVGGKTDFTVNIALIVDGVPVAGVVHAPARSRIWTGSPQRADVCDVEGGKLDRAIAISGSNPGDPVRIVASKSHRTPETDAFIARFEEAETVSVGSSLKFCLLAEGSADIYPRFGRTMEWDTAAGDAVLRAAGGTTLSPDGSVFRYGKRNQADDSDFANGWFLAASRQALPILEKIMARDG